MKVALSRIACSPSTKLKEQIIKNCLTIPHFKTVCYYALNPFYSYNIREIKASPIRTRNGTINDIFVFLDQLRLKRGASDKEKNHLARLASFDQATVDVVNYILNKDLRCGAGVKIFRKAGLEVPEHSLALCLDGSCSKKLTRVANVAKFKKRAGRVSNVCQSLKMNGVRVWAVIFPNNTVEYLSRKGKKYPNFSAYDENVLDIRNKVWDELDIQGKLVILDGESDTTEKTFKSVMQDARRINGADSSKFRFNVFDIVLDEMTLLERYNLLVKLIGTNYSNVSYVPHETIESYEDAYKFLDEVDANGEEGIVLKCWDSLYERKRSSAWMKLKKFFSDEFKVVGWSYGEGKYSDVVGTIHVVNNGVITKVNVRNDEQRKDFLTHLPKLVEVRYKEETEDGKLLFPTLLTVRDDK